MKGQRSLQIYSYQCMESIWWLHHERVGDLSPVWGGLYWPGEATNACGSMEPMQVLSVRGLVDWPIKVVHVSGSLCPVIHLRHHPIHPMAARTLDLDLSLNACNTINNE